MKKIKKLRLRLRTRLWRLFHPHEWAKMQQRWHRIAIGEIDLYNPVNWADLRSNTTQRKGEVKIAERLTKIVAEGVPVYIGEDSQYDTGVIAAEMTIDQVRKVLIKLAEYENRDEDTPGTWIEKEDLYDNGFTIDRKRWWECPGCRLKTGPQYDYGGKTVGYNFCPNCGKKLKKGD